MILSVREHCLRAATEKANGWLNQKQGFSSEEPVCSEREKCVGDGIMGLR